MSERITKRIAADCMELFPTGATPMKIYRDKTNITYHISDNMWNLVAKLYEYENLENKLKNEGIQLDAAAIASHIISSVDNLSPKMLEAAYRKHELEYRTEDARRHIEEQIDDNDLTTKAILMESAEILAERFINKYDCNIPENYIWSNLIDQYCIEAELEQ